MRLSDDTQDMLNKWMEEAMGQAPVIKLRLLVDMDGGAVIGKRGDIFHFRPPYAEFQLREHPQAWEKVEDAPPAKKLERKPGHQVRSNHVPGAPPEDKAVNPSQVVRR